jgi:hypothetical protein
MDARRFEALLDAYGAEPRRWPAAERSAAEAFARTADGPALLAAGAEVDDWLAMSATPQPSAALREAVLAQAPRPDLRNGLTAWWTPLRGWAPGAGLAAAGLAGVLFGATLTGAPTEPQVELLLAEAGPYDEAALVGEAP